MISKEESKELKDFLKETINNTYADKRAEKFYKILQYIEELEREVNKDEK